MDSISWGWIGLFCVLFITSFGIFWFITILLSLVTFLIGFFSLLYVKVGDIEEFNNKCIGNPLSADTSIEGGLPQIVKKMIILKKVQKSDSRVTGSDLIDSSLQEILGYIIRDYISPWYRLISRDSEFTDTTVRRTAQTFAINISNRVKEIDWIPYITTRLVDDAASHLRLFKQARAKINAHTKPKTPKNSPLKDIKHSPKKLSHRRNKSETDINWHVNKSGDLRKDTERISNSSKICNTKNKKISLEEQFFDLECLMEKNLLCRDGICENEQEEKEFLLELVEIVLYILLPDEDFQCRPLRFILRDIFTNAVILPLFATLSDPDYINQTIIWLCLSDGALPSEIFLTTIRLTDSCDELKSTKELVSKEIQLLRSRDSGGESDLSIKQQLSSLQFVLRLMENRLSKMENLETDSFNVDYIQLDNIKKINLSLDQILKNNVALSYFMDYITSQGTQIDLFFYLNIEGWKVSVEQQLSDVHLNKMKGISENITSTYDSIRTTALSIFEQYLGDKCEQRVQVKVTLVQTLYFKIRNLNEVPNEQWFDAVQGFVHDKMETNPDYLPAFKKSKAYVRLLQELDLLQQNPVEDDAISLNSYENLEVTVNCDNKESPINKVTVNDSFLTVDHLQKSAKHTRSFSDVDVITLSNANDDLKLSDSIIPDAAMAAESDKMEEKNLKIGNFTLTVNVIETGIVCEKGKTFGVYAIRVSRQYDTGYLEEWHIYRRYSDFHDLYTKIKDKFTDLSKLSFPGKKTFHNMDRAVLERRMKMLGNYMHQVCQPDLLVSHIGLKELLMTFLEQGEYDKATAGPISSTITTLVNPIKSGMKTIKNMPEQFINTVDEVMGGISKVFHTKSGRSSEAIKVGASIEQTDDNIPLRIMLLLMDEVFDLKSRNQWLRRRIVTLLRQIIRTMFGDIVNRKILDYVSFITSPKNVAHYLYVFKQSFWPNGNKCEKKADRDEDTRNRTRIAAKVALLSLLSDELKHIIGSETMRRGLLTVFELFQKPVLNRRLLYVLMEGIICTLFPEKDMLRIFHKLHSKSKRLQSINATNKDR